MNDAQTRAPGEPGHEAAASSGRRWSVAGVLAVVALAGAGLWLSTRPGPPPAPPAEPPKPAVAAKVAAEVTVVAAESPPPAPSSAVAPEPPAPDPAVQAAPQPDPAPEPPPPEPVPEPPAEPPPPAPQPTLAGELERVRPVLEQLRCSLLRAEGAEGALLIAGTVTSEADHAYVQRVAATVAEPLAAKVDVAVAKRGLCEPLTLIAPLRAANTEQAEPLTVAIRAVGGTVTAGQELVLDLRGPAFAGHLQVDYFTLDGGVVHLLPNPLEPTAPLDAGAVRRLGERGGGGRFWSVRPPFGQELVIAIASVTPLFATLRPEAEPAAAYLPELRKALDDAAKGSPAPVAAAVFVTTAPGP
ncbi:DUF4384 domain-containing protein [Azospirillum sp.]|uniref:DUF4384 domain-containing protein n=1 Tax=Azospirillum sp. TaxID=34012 RepID=UPI002D455EF7|nr:DUF4384 domain-containing protein [Azospirillum sp.]HYD68144.1 DUF4384 domain-containing protein [Azospirillum sp.]